MCNSINCSHDRLDDDLSDLFGDGLPSGNVDTTLADASVANTRRFETKCKSCRGTGRFVSYTGRVVGDCFKKFADRAVSSCVERADLTRRRGHSSHSTQSPALGRWESGAGVSRRLESCIDVGCILLDLVVVVLHVRVCYYMYLVSEEPSNY